MGQLAQQDVLGAPAAARIAQLHPAEQSGEFPPKALVLQAATVRWPPKDGQPTQAAQFWIRALPESHGNELEIIHDKGD